MLRPVLVELRHIGSSKTSKPPPTDVLILSLDCQHGQISWRIPVRVRVDSDRPGVLAWRSSRAASWLAARRAR